MLIKNMLFGLIKKHKVLFSILIAVSSITAGLSSGLISTYDSFKKNTQNYIQEYGLADVTIELTDLATENKIVEALNKIDEVDKVETSMEIQVQTLAGERHLMLRSIEDNSFIKFYTYEETNYEDDYVNIWVNSQYVTYNKHKIGDKIRLALSSNPTQLNLSCNMAKIVTTPEIAQFNLYNIFPVDKYDYGYAFITKSEFNRAKEKFIPKSEDIEKYNNKTNRIIIKAIPGTNLYNLKDKCTNAISPILEDENISIHLSETSKTLRGTNYFNSTIDQLKTICLLVPILFIVISFILIYLFMFQITNNMKHEIGILNALGISKFIISIILVSFALFIGIISCAIGTILGIGITSLVFNICKDFFIMPFGIGLLNIVASFLCIGIMLSILVLAGLATILLIRKVSPINVISNNANQYKPLPAPIEKLTKKSSITTKLHINNIHKNLLRFIISTTTIFLVYTIIFVAFNYQSSVNTTINETYEAFNYDAQVYKANNDVSGDQFVMDLENIKPIANVIETALVTENVNISFNSKNVELRLYGVRNDHQLIKIPDIKGNECKIQDNGIIIEEEYAKALNIQIGDNVKFKNTEIKVVDIYKLSAIKFAYLSFDTLKTLSKSQEITALDCGLIKINSPSYTQNDLVHSISKNCNYDVHTVFVDKFLESNFGGFEAIKLASEILMIFTILISILVITIMGLANLNEQLRKFSIMQTLGLGTKDISKQLFLQEINFFLIGIIVGIPVSIPLTKVVLGISDSLDTTLYFTNHWWIYILTILIIALIICITHFINIHKIRNWNIVDNLKTRE